MEAEIRSPVLRFQKKELHKYPHKYGDNYGAWLQMVEKGPYSIKIYIKDKTGKVLTVNLQYDLE